MNKYMPPLSHVGCSSQHGPSPVELNKVFSAFAFLLIGMVTAGKRTNKNIERQDRYEKKYVKQKLVSLIIKI